MKFHLRFILSVTASVVIGAVAWRIWWLIAMSLLTPVLVGLQRSRRSAATVSFGYFGAVSWPLIEAHRMFVGDQRPSVMAVLLWLVASASLALPLAFAWTAAGKALAWRLPLALVVAALPPIGIIGWASPLTCAGVLFPGTGWFGLCAACVIPGLWFITVKPAWVIPTISVLAASANFSFNPPMMPVGWTALDTSTPSGKSWDPAAELTIRRIVQSQINRKGNDVTVLPEGSIHRWNEATELFWRPTLVKLTENGKTVVVGAAQSKPQSDSYLNAALVFGGRGPKTYVQRIPVPIGMWNPLEPDTGVSLNLAGPATIDIRGQRAAVLICYEQLLVWPILHSALGHPTVMVGMANQHWIRTTTIPAAQRASIKAWSRLFTLPVVSAQNR